MEQIKKVKPLDIKSLDDAKEEIRRLWVVFYHATEKEKEELK